jgi:hypothetical protein
MGGCAEENDSSGAAGDWAVAVNEATVKSRPYENTIVPNLKQFLISMGTTFRAGTTKAQDGTGKTFQFHLNHRGEKVGRAYRKLRMTHSCRHIGRRISLNGPLITQV